jgi:hypothetical protein
MKKSVVAGAALIAGIAIAAPMLARSADNPPTAEQSAPIIPPAGQAMPDHMRGGGMTGGMSGPGMLMRARLMRRMAHRSPQQRCEERLARHAAMIAYTVTKLNLTAEQRPLWDKLDAVIETGTEKRQQLCSAMKAQAGGPTILDRVGWQEQGLAARVQSLHEARPALEQLYQALTPEQKAIIDHPFARG